MFRGEDIGIDLGTASVLVYVRGKGIVLREPSVIAMVRDTKEVKAVGAEAYRMLGRTPGNIVAVRPMRDGVIADYTLTERMLTMFLKKVLAPTARLFKPQVMVGVPSGVTEVERRAVVQAIVEAGAKRAFLIEEPLAAAIGAGINIAEPTGSMVVDIGGGSTDIAVMSLGGIVQSESLRIAGNEFDDAIIRYVRRTHNLLIGERTAEEIKIRIGAAKIMSDEDRLVAEVRGRDLITGLPKTVEVRTEDVVDALSEPLEKIVLGVRRVLENTPPELVSDIVDRGILLTGGGALLKHLDALLQEATGVPVVVAENALDAVAVGTGRALEMIPVLKDTLISSDNVLKR
ncbi:rod shape-determining protein [Marinithermus hydrothermalis]|uniref:Cell shape-determining protein MreB n=1 Tax=Marinithermus hydrothermalis (strain DSM 14884 / JCM 11576 / T1) TaxID=869210 RepID=F2NPZ2_MARHT|nr:rod shape-determining protein [Marinithermus hydrothermalis]AEB11093.1 cell shape determining protein, MreB/Mrl family [Marinithermus hydrothermalis DSM 14884]